MLYKGVGLYLPVNTLEGWYGYYDSSIRVVEDCNTKQKSAVKLLYAVDTVFKLITINTSVEERKQPIEPDILLKVLNQSDNVFNDIREIMMIWGVNILTLIKIGIIKEDDKNGVYCRTTINGVNYCVSFVEEINELYARSQYIELPEIKEQLANNKLCYVCYKRTKNRCQGCKVKYCSSNCQLCDWKQHKTICKGC